jgi:hypothetical protein
VAWNRSAGVDTKVDFLVSFLLQAVVPFKKFFCCGQLKNYAGNTGCCGWIDEVETSGIRGPDSLLWCFVLWYCVVSRKLNFVVWDAGFQC